MVWSSLLIDVSSEMEEFESGGGRRRVSEDEAVLSLSGVLSSVINAGDSDSNKLLRAMIRSIMSVLTCFC